MREESITDLSNGNWQIIIDNLDDGSYEYYVQAFDNNEEPIENSQSEIRGLIIHTSPPELLVETHEHEGYANKMYFAGTWESSFQLDTEEESTFIPYIELYLTTVEDDLEDADPVTITAEESGFFDDEGVWNWEITEEDIFEQLELESEFENGKYIFYMKTEDAAGNVTIAANEIDEETNQVIEPFMFTYSSSRPYISPNVTPVHKATQVPLNTTVQFKYISEIPVDDTDETFFDELLVVKTGKVEVPGSISWDTNDHITTITFTPEQNLEANSRYDVMINPLFKDQAGNYVHPRIWAFTTAVVEGSRSAHEMVQNNTNTCAICHSPHTAEYRNLLKGTIDLPDQEGTEENGENGDTNGGEVITDPIQSYCLACHDGTSASRADHMDAEHTHSVGLIDENGVEQSRSCAACHDPHVQTADGNQNTHHLQSHFTFDHEEITDEDGELVGFQDSKITLCETCHISNSESVDGTTTSWEAYTSSLTSFNLFSYKDRNTYELDDSNTPVTFGTADSYSLCLRCHNAEYRDLYPNVVDIKQYYLIDPVESEDDSEEMFYGHFISEDRVKDGSLINGYLACDDCHSRHGSENEMLIKSVLGHNGAIDDEGNRFTFTWNNSRDSVEGQREFCLSCHTPISDTIGDEAILPTEMYGITLFYSEHSDPNVSCASCHGGESNDQQERFRRAVHSPTKGIDPND
ncbi:MAG: Ig-like domain-containing protein [Bacillus sp. (in: Bacteria)]|nr:Ig-like domain-containing protein [Bacillus sp. (in: firmicutes)]